MSFLTVGQSKSMQNYHARPCKCSLIDGGALATEKKAQESHDLKKAQESHDLKKAQESHDLKKAQESHDLSDVPTLAACVSSCVLQAVSI